MTKTLKGYRIVVYDGSKAYSLESDDDVISLEKKKHKFKKGFNLGKDRSAYAYILSPEMPRQLLLTYEYAPEDVAKKSTAGGGEVTVTSAKLVDQEELRPPEADLSAVSEAVSIVLAGPTESKYAAFKSLFEKLTFDQFYRISEPKRILRSKSVRGPALDIDMTQDGMYYWFNFKSFPSTTGLRHKGYIKFFKPKDMISPDDRRPLDTIPCFVDCQCLAPETLVLMADGKYKRIDQIRPGDMVYTHLGRVRRVLGNVGRNVKKGETVYRIRVSGFPLPFLATGNHPFYALRGNTTCKCGCGKSLPDSGLKRPALVLSRKYLKNHNPPANRIKDTVIEAVKIAYSSEKTTYEKLSEMYRISYNSVGNILSGRLGLRPEVKNDPDFDWVKVDHFRRHEWLLTPWLQKNETPSDLGLDPDLIRLLGYYAADGHIQGDRVSFAFGIDEKETLVDDVVRTVHSAYSKYPGKFFRYPHPRRGGSKGDLVKVDYQNVQTNRKRLQKYVSVVCYITPSFKKSIELMIGKGSRNKALSSTFMGMSDDDAKNFLSGLFLGDGHIREFGYVRYTSVSPALVWGVSSLLNRLKVRHCITKIGGTSMAIDIAEGASAYAVTGWMKPYLKDKSLKRREQGIKTDRRPDYVRDDGCLRSVNSCVPVPEYRGRVFDLSVEEDQSFIVHGVATHNCPDYRYRWAWSNKQQGSGAVGPGSLNQSLNRPPWITNPSGAPGLCKHLLALRDYIYGQVSDFPGEGDDAPARLDRLTKASTKRWINIDGEMQAARDREKKYRQGVDALKRGGDREPPTDDIEDLIPKRDDTVEIPAPPEIGEPLEAPDEIDVEDNIPDLETPSDSGAKATPTETPKKGNEPKSFLDRLKGSASQMGQNLKDQIAKYWRRFKKQESRDVFNAEDTDPMKNLLKYARTEVTNLIAEATPPLAAVAANPATPVAAPAQAAPVDPSSQVITLLTSILQTLNTLSKKTGDAEVDDVITADDVIDDEAGEEAEKEIEAGLKSAEEDSEYRGKIKSSLPKMPGN